MKSHFLLLISTFLISSCATEIKFEALQAWNGKYFYEEQPIKVIAGYYMVMEWQLEIKDTSGKYIGNLEINGQQTYSKLQGSIVGDAKTISFIYNKAIDGSDENLKSGDTLFQLKKDKNSLITKWKKMEPRLMENPPKQCNCFQREKLWHPSL